MGLIVYTVLTLTFWFNRLITTLLNGWGLQGNLVLVFFIGFLIKIILPIALAAFGLLWVGEYVGNFANQLPGILKSLVMIVGMLAFGIPLVIEIYILKNYEIVERIR